MKNHLFTEKEIGLIRFIKSNEPVGVWANVIQYIFVYNDFYIKFKIDCCEKILVAEHLKLNIENSDGNQFEQYVMSVRIEKMHNQFVPNEGFEKISFNEKISEVYLVRSLYYFTEYHEVIGNKNKTYSKNSGMINPNIEINKSIDIKYKCLVDVGIVIQTENFKSINCFLINNDEDFAINSFYINDNLIETEKEKYEFIKI